ncbi:MAG TPA: Smr/MutS family protein [Caulobacteraceae bacterium]|nr:Smr/MutS family protein [Caulobacteraceae bacterium]
MKRAAEAEDLRLWAVIAATVRPLKANRAAPAAKAGAAVLPLAPPGAAAAPRPRPGGRPGAPRPIQAASPRPIQGVETALHRRLARGRERLVARIDLHGLGQDAAKAALGAFIARSADEGWRAVLVITGKGAQGDGVLRRRAPDWLSEPSLARHVAGFSEAHRRHGGEGALYVALKRPR